MQNTWITSDFHFFHYNILKFQEERRNILGLNESDMENVDEAVEKQNQWLIELWNKTVKKQDIIYFLGDFSFANRENTEKLLKKLNGKKHLIVGNHDKSLVGLENYFESVNQIKEVKFHYKQYDWIDSNETFCIEICHYPLLTWNRRTHGSCMVHGHCHGSIDNLNIQSNELRVDVGLDSTLSNYKILNIKDVYSYFCNIRNNAGCETFQEYAEQLMNKQGVRM